MVRVRDLLARKPSKLVTVEPDAHIGTAIALLMSHNVGGLPVMSADGSILGYVAERDIVRAVRLHGGTFQGLRVEQIMRPAPLCDADDTIEEIMLRMTMERLRHLVVRDGDKIVGIVSVGDIVRNRLEELETEAGVLRDYVAAHRAVR
jgi:CBS domain-containing protein